MPSLSPGRPRRWGRVGRGAAGRGVLALALVVVVSVLATGCGAATPVESSPRAVALPRVTGASLPSGGGALRACPIVAPPPGPALVGLDPEMWLNVEQAGGSPESAITVRSLQSAASAALTRGPWTVTASRHRAPGGDPHQYVTLSRYWWPNKQTKDGLPYVRRDGRTDPRIAEYPDESYLDNTVGTVNVLARGYSVLRNEAYAARAVTLLKVFFLDPATAMAPDVIWGQFVPGRPGARGDGILDTRVLIDLTNDLTLLQGSLAFTAADQAQINVWLVEFLHWMLTSELGKSAAAAPNNHGTWYDAEAASLSLYLGHPQESLRIIGKYVSKDLVHQVEANGAQPLELARTNSWTYSTFNLDAGLQLATVAAMLGYDLFDCRGTSGGSLAQALGFLLPYATRSERWTHQQICGFDASFAALPTWMAATWFDDQSARTALSEIAPGPAGAADGVDPVNLATLASNTQGSGVGMTCE